jgi:2-succinyl-6-hydroxy-2,4-cyclohexadiene-1-carboxylate synthase
MEVNGVTYHAETAGRGEPLILLHGFTGSAASWEPFIPDWSRRYRIVAVDIIGHGSSDAPPDVSRYSMEHAVDDLAALMDALDMDAAAVLGYSMGGRLALSLAALKPEKVRALILESSSPGLSAAEERLERARQDEALAGRIEREGLEWFVAYWENLPLFQSVKRLPQEIQERIRRQRLNNRALGLANSLRGMGAGAQPSWWEHLPLLPMPVQLIAGEWDGKYMAIARRMQEMIPRCRFTPVAQAGHMVHVEQAQIFDKIVMEFLEQVLT